ncbi:MAG TPA: alpha/beta fold hydrolase [Patescibacteria group bacterium]|nr:alpha/beta fold hydrolase [Patescibacteria group bacterium]
MKKVSFKSNGFKLVGILHSPSKSTKKAIIMAHGLKVDKDEGGIFIRTANKLTQLGVAVFRFDFRGCGESEGKFADRTIRSDIQDLANAFGFMEYEGYQKFSLLGASWGGGIGVLFLKDNPKFIKSLVLWNPALDYKSGINKLIIPYLKRKIIEMIKKRTFKIKAEKFDFNKKLVIQMIKYKPYQALRQISCPTLIIHGDKDEKVPLEDSIKYYKLTKGPSKLEIIKGSSHGFHIPEAEKKVMELTLNFFKENC